MPDRKRATFLRPILTLAVGTALTTISPSATFQVSNNADAGPGSLRQAVLDANALPGADSIEFQVAGVISLTSGQLVVSESLALNGPGADLLVIDAGQRSRIFSLTSGPVTMTGLTLSNGRAPALQPGGGVLSNADLTMLRCAVRNCQTPLTPGVNADGGGVFQNSSRLFVAEQCLFAGNSVALGTGGAVRSTTGSSAQFRNCTFSGNSATQGGAVSCASPGLFDFCTVVDNSATSAGGGVWSPGVPSRVSNSIVFRNSAPSGPDWLGPAQSGGFNMLGVTFGSSGWTPSDRSGVDPLLGPLADNGGGTECFALLAGSPAQDMADPASTVVEDQRGLGRPQRTARDVGAFELEFVNTPPVANAGSDQTVPSDGTSASVQLDGSASSDPDGDDLTYLWSENGIQLSNEVLPTVNLANGSHTLTLVVTDEWGATSQDQVSVTVEPPATGDQRKPRIRNLRVRPHILWPADGNLKNVLVSYTVRDNTDPNPQVWLTVTSNQADSGLGPNDRPGDMVVVDKNNLKLRAERFLRARVYTVTIHAKDRDGNEATRKVRVLVPRPRPRCR